MSKVGVSLSCKPGVFGCPVLTVSLSASYFAGVVVEGGDGVNDEALGNSGAGKGQSAVDAWLSCLPSLVSFFEPRQIRWIRLLSLYSSSSSVLVRSI